MTQSIRNGEAKARLAHSKTQRSGALRGVLLIRAIPSQTVASAPNPRLRKNVKKSADHSISGPAKNQHIKRELNHIIKTRLRGLE